MGFQVNVSKLYGRNVTFVRVGDLPTYTYYIIMYVYSLFYKINVQLNFTHIYSHKITLFTLY